ncbi:MAG: nucleotidyltransferase domain-containing protein [Patescibacteria group bacterium]
MVQFNAQKIKEIAGQYNLADVFMFGSQIDGFARKDSDLDVGVRFENGLPAAEHRGKIYAELFADLGTCFPGQKLDLVFIDEAPLHFKYQIFTKGKMIFNKNKEKSLDFQERVFNLYRDQKYFIDEFFKGVLESA